MCFLTWLYLGVDRLGLYVPHVLSCSVLQASWRELFQGKDCWFLLHALIWRHCVDWDSSDWRDDTVFVRVICEDYIPQQLSNIHDGSLLIFVGLWWICFQSSVCYYCFSKHSNEFLFYRSMCGASKILSSIWVSWASSLSQQLTYRGSVKCLLDLYC